MAKSDGSVIIDTRIDTSGFGKGITDAKQKVSVFSSSLNKLGNTIKSTFSQSNTESVGKSYNELKKEISKVELQLDKLIEKQIRFTETGGNIKSRAMAGMEYDIEMTRNKLEELRSQLALTSEETPKKVGKMKNWIERLKKAFNSLNKSTKASHRSILAMLGTSILFSTVFRAISAITKGFSDGINNLVQYSDKANSTMSALKSSLTQLKNSFATAFMPIITAVTPAITQFINLISKAANMVSSFFAALTGKNVYTKAIEVQENYADSLNKTSSAAKNAKNNLSSLDELHIISQDYGSEGGSVLPENMFAEENVQSPIFNLAEKVKEIFADEDWSGLGTLLSDGIIWGLNTLSDKLEEVDWEGIGRKIGQFLKDVDWAGILIAVGNFLETLIDAAVELWKGSFDANPIGTAIATALAGYFLVNTIGINPTIVIGAATFLIGFDIGKELGKLLFPEDAKWYESFSFFGEGGFFDTLFNDFENALNGFYLMLTDYENNPIVSGFLTLFAFIVATVLFGPLGFIAMLVIFGDEIMAAFKTAWEKVTEWWDKSGIKKWIDEKVKPWTSKETWVELLSGLKEAFSIGFKNAVNAAISIFNKFIDYINEKMYFEWPAFKDPIFGTEIFGAGSIQLFTIPKIPMLARGAVIPPNAPFMAMLGDQRHGTNLEAPEDLIRQIVREEAGGNAEMMALLSEIAKNTRDTADKEMIIGDRDIAKANARGQRSMGYALIEG